MSKIYSTKDKWFLPFLCALLLFAGGCAPKAEAVPGEELVRALFTTNQDGRWEKFQSAGTGEAGLEAYLEPFSALCTDRGLYSLTSNRYVYRLDELAAEGDCTVTPTAYSVDGQEGDTVNFSVTLSVSRDGAEIGTAVQAGQLTLSEDGRVDSLWLEDMSSLIQVIQS